MPTALSTREHVARKTHTDNGSQYFDWLIIRDENKKLIIDPKEADYMKFTEQEVVDIQHSIDNKWRIQVGETYCKQASVDGGDFYVYKTRKAIHAICDKYNMYSDE